MKIMNKEQGMMIGKQRSFSNTAFNKNKKPFILFERLFYFQYL